MDPWDFELAGTLAAHRPTLGWLVEHIQSLLPDDAEHTHLLSMASDLCDAGHVHLDIVLWILTDTDLHSIVVSEEHFDRGPESVETTFETTVTSSPLDTVAGTQISTASHPDGLQLDVALAIMVDNPQYNGHADPMGYEDPDVVSYAMNLQPTSLTFTVDPERTGELVEFGRALLAARAAYRRRP